jgi:UDP-N-acetylenolpyruvoylglucosamine reductase
MLHIQQNVSLLKYNTFKIDAKTKYFVIIKSQEDIYELVQSEEFTKNKRFLLG